MSYVPSIRADILTRRTYNRPLDDEGLSFETWEETVERVINHQRWLWERARGTELGPVENAELSLLRRLMLERKVSTSGRTLWLGGTDIAKKREASQFNCAHTFMETVQDVVDMLWLLLQGCGVGFTPTPGSLNGFARPIKNISVIRSSRTEKGGLEHNEEHYDEDSRTWTIKVGDSAEAWAKSVGKLLAGKFPAEHLIIDLSEIRPAGERLAGYGWISSGDSSIARAYVAIAAILNRRAGNLLTRIDLLDVANHLGTVLSSRRSAEIALVPYGDPEWEEFALAKRHSYEEGHKHRQQSNNSIVFYTKPSREEVEYIFQLMAEGGGSEPGFINAEAAKRRAPWFKGVNPCAEILLGNKSFCNLTEVDVGKFKGDSAGLHEAVRIAARCNYRQTCVDLRDGVLQEAWHLNNEFLRLCGVGLTGLARRSDLNAYDYRSLERATTSAAYGMADELGTPRPKNVTTVKPSGTLSKIMDTTEGVHRPLAKYIFNHVQFSKGDPLVPKLKAAYYKTFNHPSDPESILVRFPVKWDDVPFHIKDGMEVNLESAVDQLERYKLLQQNWTQQNTSITVSYDPSEVPAIIDWLLHNWDSYVGVSFIYRTDPTMKPEDIGYEYLPQQPVTEDQYNKYVAKLVPIDMSDTASLEEISGDECATGVCPIK